ncbi:MAG TPA: DUF1684 domain-containing protein [Candidatus Limnocylindrales bacterium]|nr:DUF1684 domain-containing protein [Candidatus Limnocylindrales bacterium]
MTTGAERTRETVDLADWRRRVADLYAEVRRLSAMDVGAAIALWRETRETLFREHPSSPLPADRRARFRASHFEHDPALRFDVEVVPGAAAAPSSGPIDFGVPLLAASELPVSAGGTMSFTRIGHVQIPFREGPRRLGVFWMDGYAGGLFIPFRDATNGAETYAPGRYLLDSAKSADLGRGASDSSLILDFNFAYQPSCAFDPKWACPLAPPENRLDIPIRAGERLG